MQNETRRVGLPRNVLAFERLMYGALVLGIVTLPFNERLRDALARFGPIILLFGAVAYGLFVLVIWAIARRRKNWLRWTWVVLFVTSLPFDLPSTLRELHSHPVFVVISLTTYVLKATAFFLIFTGDAVPWYRNGAPAAVLE